MALLDEHQQNVQKLTNVIETERIKQYQELNQKLHANNAVLDLVQEKTRRNSFDTSAFDMEKYGNPNGSSWNETSDKLTTPPLLRHSRSRSSSWDINDPMSDSHTPRVKTVALEVNPARYFDCICVLNSVCIALWI